MKISQILHLREWEGLLKKKEGLLKSLEEELLDREVSLQKWENKLKRVTELEVFVRSIDEAGSKLTDDDKRLIQAVATEPGFYAFLKYIENIPKAMAMQLGKEIILKRDFSADSLDKKTIDGFTMAIRAIKIEVDKIKKEIKREEKKKKK